MDNSKNIKWIAVTLVLLVVLAVLGVKYTAVRRELRTRENESEEKQINEKVVDFFKLFIAKVLRAEKDVGFEERLRLENAVREIEDENILNVWGQFVESRTDAEAQENIKDLLESLVNKIKIK